MKLFRIRVWSFSASYSGYRKAKSGEQAIEDQRREYRRNRDNRAGWYMSAVEVDNEDEED